MFDFAAPLNNRFVWYELGLPRIEDWTDWAVVNGIDMRIVGYLQTKRSNLLHLMMTFFN